MKLINKFAALLLAAVMLFSLAGCSSDGPVVTIKGTDIEPGVYLAHLFASYLDASGKYGKPDEDILKQTIEGVNASDYIVDKAIENCKTLVAVQNKFEEMKLEWTDEDQKVAENSASYHWNFYGPVYEENGISFESLTSIYKVQTMMNKMFAATYGKDGTKPVSDEELEKYVTENMVGFRYIGVDLTDKDNKPLTEEKAQEAKDIIKKYYDLASKDNTGLEKVTMDFVKDYSAMLGLEVPAEDEIDTSDFLIIQEKDSKTPSEEFMNKINAAKIGDLLLIEEEGHSYAVEIVDILTIESEQEPLHAYALSMLKSEEFTKEIKEIADSYDVVKHDKAMKKYSPKHLKVK